VKPGNLVGVQKNPSRQLRRIRKRFSGSLLVQNVPKVSSARWATNRNIIRLIIRAVAFGIALRALSQRPIKNVQDFVEIAYEVLLIVLHWGHCVLSWWPRGSVLVRSSAVSPVGPKCVR